MRDTKPEVILLAFVELKSSLALRVFRLSSRLQRYRTATLHTPNLTLTKSEEREFLASFNREYSSSPDYISMSFMARMEEDIKNRKNKEETLRSAEKRYRRNKYGSLSKERVSTWSYFQQLLKCDLGETAQ